MSEDARSLKSLAAQRLREGRVTEAAQIFKHLAELEPADPNHWFNLGYSRRMSREYEPALDAYAQALKRGVSRPEDVYINRAVILSEYLHDMTGAEEELRKAVAANPGSPSAWLNLGNMYEDLGDTEAARKSYNAALKVAPNNGRATARIAAIDVYEKGVEAVLPSLREAAQRRWPTAQDAAEVHFALGNALDSIGDHAAAFEFIVEGNRLAAAARQPAMRYNPAAQERLIDALIELPSLPAAEPLPAEENPVFICGMFRSGSTLVEQLLARHPDITPGGELEFIPAIVHENLTPYPQLLAAISSQRAADLRDRYLGQLQRLFPKGGRVTDKRPDNFLHIGLIKALFPRARIVHTVRHPLDNIISAFFLYFGSDVRYSESLEDLAHFYVQYRRLMEHWRARFGGDIHAVDYDALVVDPRSELEPLVQFLGIAWDDACLTQESTSAVRTASNWQVRKALHSKSSGRWKHYEQQLSPVRGRLLAAGLL